MSKKKIARLRRPAVATAHWTDREVLALVDAVLIARDTELAQRMLMVLSSRHGVSNRPSTLADLAGVPHHAMQRAAPRIHTIVDAGQQLGHSLDGLEGDPAAYRPKLKRLAATIGKELAHGREKLTASGMPA